MSQAASEVYTKLLLVKKLGYPLWYPELSSTLPDAYLEKGISIGDVGTITPDGSFDFLFNICEAGDGPVNCNDVPSGFAPLSLREREKNRFPNMQGPGAIISSASVKKRSFAAEGLSQGNPYGQTYFRSALADLLLQSPSCWYWGWHSLLMLTREGSYSSPT